MNIKPTQRLVGIFPYLVLFEPIEILGVRLDVTSGEELEAPLHEILSIFRDGRGHPIQLATSISVDIPAGTAAHKARLIQNLTALLGYLLLDPEHPASSPKSENLTIWMFSPGSSDAEAWLATPNMDRYMSLDPVKDAIYPPTPDMTIIQDHVNPDAAGLALSQDANWINDQAIADRDRVLLAMYWYGRSFSANPQEDDRTRIVHLATAFEVLLRIGLDRGKRRSLQAELGKLLGDHSILDEWTEQFYQARSEIVHRGWTADLLFHHPLATRAHASLVRSGQRILRLAVESEIRLRAGGALARTMPRLFYERYVQPDLEPNEARLTQLQTIGRLRGRSAHEFLATIGRLTFTDTTGSLNDLVAVGRRLLRLFIQHCLGNQPPDSFVHWALAAEPKAESIVTAYRQLQAGLRNEQTSPWPARGTSDQYLWRIERAVRHFAAYAETVAPEMAKDSSSTDRIRLSTTTAATKTQK